MKKAKLIYNPMSGGHDFKHYLDDVIDHLQNNGAGYEVHIFRTMTHDDILPHISSLDKNYYDVIIAVGGDGTISDVVNAIVKNDLNIKLGVIPSGTANDFARFLNLPTNPIDCIKIITDGNFINVDLGKANDSFFINVLSFGCFANVSHNVDKNLKLSIGKLAYYFKALETLPKLKPIPLKITRKNQVIKDKFYLVLILNSSGAGGFNRLAPYSSMTDGNFDFVGFKHSRFFDTAKSIFHVIIGDHLEQDKDVVFFQDNKLTIELDTNENTELFSITDIDGELGPNFPINFEVIKNKLSVFAPTN